MINRQPNALYEQVKQNILKIISERDLKPHDPLPSEGELARLFDVSRMTSKLALQALADEGVVYRMARRGTFLAANDREKQALPKPRRKPMIALVIGSIDDYSGKLIADIEVAARASDFDLLLKLTSGDMEQEEAVLRQLSGETDIAGIILFPGNRKVCGNEVLRLRLANYPIVIIDRVFREIEIDSVYHDHFQGAYDITKYLIDSGHREIGYLSSPFDEVSSRIERYQGYVQAILNHNIPLHMNNINLEFRWTEHAGEGMHRIIQDLIGFLSGRQSLTAVVCLDDFVAAYLLYAALSAGIKVPEQLSITGFSDINLSQLIPVSLTTVRQHSMPLAEEAVRVLVDRMRDPGRETQTVKIKTEIMERNSVAIRSQEVRA